MIDTTLLADLRQRGIELCVDRNDLRYRAPRGVMTNELRSVIADHKVTLMTMLHAEAMSLERPPRLTSPATPSASTPAVARNATRAPGPISREIRHSAARKRETSATTGDWFGPYTADLPDAYFQAVVDADLARHGWYWSHRQYAEPAEDPRSIWARAGLTPLDVPYERSHGEVT
jgi:hypothetical protein